MTTESPETNMTAFQALVTGALMGALLKAPTFGILIEAEPTYDDDGNYLPVIKVTGKESGEQLLVIITQHRGPMPLDAAIEAVKER